MSVPWPRPAILCLAGLVGLVVLHTVVFIQGWDLTWDDGAITMAFARTFAQTGRIALTPASDPVEGFSTPLWMLTLTAWFEVHRDPDRLLAGAKLGSLVFSLLDLLLIFALANRFLRRRGAALAVVAAVAGLEIAFREAANGMENPLWLCLYLIAILTWRDRSRPRARLLFAVATSLFVLVRWEAIWFLLPFVASAARQRGWRGCLRLEFFVWIGLFALLTVARWLQFGLPVPNPIIAKRWAPYTPLDRWWLHHFKPLALLGLDLLPLLLVVGLAMIMLRIQVRRSRARLDGGRQSTTRARIAGRVGIQAGWLASLDDDTLIMMIILMCALVFNVVIGQSSGPKNRMFYLALPFSIMLLWRGLLAIMPSLRPVRRRIVGLAVVLSLLATHRVGVRDMLRRPYPITVENVRSLAPALDQVRRACGHDTLTFAGCDMGRLALYGQDLRVIDLGLICDPVLARTGYSGLDEYIFKQVRPDLIETHGVWTQLIESHAPGRLPQDYDVLFVNGIRFFIRKDLLPQIPAAGLRTGFFGDAGHASAYDTSHFLYRHHAGIDWDLNASERTYFVLRS